jgi:hypothetical protein
MAKRFLLEALVKLLGEFVEIDESNLSLGVWSGQIILTDLKLKTDNLLKKFKFTIFHGSVRSLEILVPWTSLLTSPLKIKLDGILLDVGPMEASYPQYKSGSSEKGRTDSSLKNDHKEEIIARLIEEKLSKLKVYDEYLELTYSLLMNESSSRGFTGDSKGSNKDEGYLQQWTTRIIDNVELTLSNIHIRYEDSITIPNHCFACGMTLESFIISTCDDNWQPAYISKANASSVNKLASMVNLGIYWDVESDHLSDLSYEKWSQVMTSMIFVRGNDLIAPSSLLSSSLPPSILPFAAVPSSHPSSPLCGSAKLSRTKDLKYLVFPNNNVFFLKLIHHKILSPSNNNIRFDATVDCSNIKLQIDSIQYKQMMLLSYHLSSTSQVKIPFSYHPHVRPRDSPSCRLWWKYVFFLLRIKPKYLRLLKLSQATKAEESDLIASFTEIDRMVLDKFRKRLSLDVLKKFHQLAYAEMIEERRSNGSLPLFGIQKESNDINRSQKESGSFLSGWFGRSYDDDIQEENEEVDDNSPPGSVHSELTSSSAISGITFGGDISIEGLISEFDKQELLQTKQLFHGVKVKLFSSSDLLISSYWKPTAEVRTALFLGIEKNDSFFGVDCQLTDLSIKETLDISSFHPQIVSVKSETFGQGSVHRHPNKATISLSVKHQEGKTKVLVTSLPIEIYLNKIFIESLLADFQVPQPFDQHEPVGSPLDLQSIAQQNTLSEAPSANVSLRTQFRIRTREEIVKSAKTGIEIEFQAHAPKFIFPEDCTRDCGFLLLDCGYLAFKGSLYDKLFTCNVSLTAINAGIPSLSRDLYVLNDTSLLLVKVSSLFSRSSLFADCFVF